MVMVTLLHHPRHTITETFDDPDVKLVSDVCSMAEASKVEAHV